MSLPCTVLDDLTKVGGHFAEAGGKRKYADWAAEMKGKVSADLTEPTLQRVWSRVQVELAAGRPSVAARMQSPVFADQLGQRVGKQNAQDFIDHLDNLHPDLYEKLIRGETLTSPERQTVAEIYRQYTMKGKTKQGKSPGMVELSAAIAETNRQHQRTVQQLKRQARNGSGGPSTPEGLLTSAIARSVGRENAGKFMEALKGKDTTLHQKLIDGDTLTGPEQNTVGTLFNSFKKATRTPQAPVAGFRELQLARKSVRQAESRASAKTPPTPEERQEQRIVAVKNRITDLQEQLRTGQFKNSAPQAVSAELKTLLGTEQSLRSEINRVKRGPTVEEMLRRAITPTLGKKENADNFIADLKANHSDILNKLLTDTPLNSTESKIIAELHETHRDKSKPAPATPRQAVADIKSAAKEARLAQAKIDNAPKVEAGRINRRIETVNKRVEQNLADMSSLFPEKAKTPKPDDILPEAVKAYRDANGDLTRFAKEVRKHLGDSVPDSTIQDVYSKAADQFRQDYRNVDAIKREIGQTLNSARVSSLGEQLRTAYKAGLLSSPRSLVRNIASHTARATVQEAARIPAVIWDIGDSAASNRPRSIALNFRPVFKGETPVLPGYPGNGNSRLAEVWRQTNELIKTGSITDDPFSNSNLAQFGLSHETVYKNPIIHTAINGIFRLHAVTDRTFRMAAFYRAIDDNALVQAMNEAKAGTIPKGEVSTRADALRKNPTAEMVAEAVYQGQAAVFQVENPLSTALSTATRKTMEVNPIAGGAMDITAPFTKVPVNVVLESLDIASGAVGAPIRRLTALAMKKALTPEQNKQIALQFGKGSVGVGLFILGTALARAGILTGFNFDKEGYFNHADKGVTEGSLVLGGKSYSLKALEPVAFTLITAASIQEQWDKDHPWSSESQFSGEGVAHALVTAGRSAKEAISNLPYISEYKRSEESNKSQSKYAPPPSALDSLVNGVSSFAASATIPTAIADLAKTMDNRRTKPGKAGDYFLQRTPWARGFVPTNTKSPLPMPEGPLYNPFTPVKKP